MKRLKEYILLYCREIASIMRNEYRAIFSDPGVMLVIVFAIFIYATLYSFGYNNEVLQNVPIAVIDNDRTHASRALTTSFDAGPNTYVAYDVPDMESAKDLFFDHKVYGIVYIPRDYEKNLVGGLQANVSIYCDASYFLMYRQVFQEIVASISTSGAMVGFQRLVAKGINIPQAKAVTQPVIYQSHNLFNPYLGYGTFIMPAIIIVILQQTALIGIGMIGGTWREYNLYARLTPPGRKRLSTIPTVFGKALTYISIYAVTATYVLTVHYHMFGYPMNGNLLDCAAVIIPYLLACIFMGIAVSTLFSRRENSLCWMLWTSIPILLLSGASLPKECFPHWLYMFGKIFPSSSAISAYIRVQSMGASFEEILPEIEALWRLVLIYGGLSVIGIHLVLNHDLARRTLDRLRRQRKKVATKLHLRKNTR